jgi:hypothetical protein
VDPIFNDLIKVAMENAFWETCRLWNNQQSRKISRHLYWQHQASIIILFTSTQSNTMQRSQ